MVIDSLYNEDIRIVMSVDVNNADADDITKELKEWFKRHSVGMSGFKITRESLK